MPQHIGIVACSAEGAALCYRTVCTEGEKLFGTHNHPEVTMHTHPLAEYVKCIDADDWRGVANLMLSSAAKLAQAGAQFLICPDNTIHRALGYVKPRSPLPWLHIAEVVSREAAERKFRRVGILGTQWLVDSDIYPQYLAELELNYMRPLQPERMEISRIIMDELVKGVFKPESTRFIEQVIARMKGEQCDAMILGCTELPLVITEANSALPLLDSTRLLARAALRRAAEPAPPQAETKPAAARPRR